jgi:hypothetical protein
VSQHKLLLTALAMKEVMPFCELSLQMLLAIAEVAISCEYIEGEAILPGEAVPDVVHVPIAGHAQCNGRKIDHVFDIAAVAFDHPLQYPYLAGPEGCSTVLLTKSHVFTLLRECPELSLKLAGLSGGVSAVA